MSLVLDIILAAAAIAIVIGCVSRGFLKSVISLVSTVVAFIVAWIFTPKLSAFLSEKVFSGAIGSSVENTLNGLMPKNGDGFNISKLLEDSPEDLNRLLRIFGTTSEKLAQDYGSSTAADGETVRRMADTISEPIVGAASGVTAFIALFVGTLILLAILSAVLGLFVRLPVIKGTDKVLGFVLGMVLAAIIVIVLAKIFPMAVTALEPVNPDLFGKSVIDGTVLVKPLSEIDLFGIWAAIFQKA